MNDTIERLMKQAMVTVHSHGAFGEHESYQQLDPVKFAELTATECASIVYKTCEDGDAGAMAILYEFNIDNARNLK